MCFSLRLRRYLIQTFSFDKDEDKKGYFFQCYQQQKFMDVILVMEEGTLFCHKIVLDSCSEYFANIFKNKFLDDKNKNIVICLPKDIVLWEMQALLSYMYNGEVMRHGTDLR
jgi:hypothetical protein